MTASIDNVTALKSAGSTQAAVGTIALLQMQNQLLETALPAKQAP
ncbi:hypothetical protein [Pseudoduganella armeniaca]|nr:hypothetical protein [Pseudoduganella armeniaca]